MLEAAMSSKTPCTDRLIKAEFHALFSAAHDVAEITYKKTHALLMNVLIFGSHVVP